MKLILKPYTFRYVQEGNDKYYLIIYNNSTWIKKVHTKEEAECLIKTLNGAYTIGYSEGFLATI
jgi:hypothetical protein